MLKLHACAAAIDNESSFRTCYARTLIYIPVRFVAHKKAELRCQVGNSTPIAAQ